MSRQQRLTLVATILGSTVVFLDGTVVNVALPSISDSLDAGLAGQQWVVEAYMLTMVSLLLVGGSLGDQFGRRRVYVIGLLGFGAASALCAVAPTEEFLVGARALQGNQGAVENGNIAGVGEMLLQVRDIGFLAGGVDDDEKVVVEMGDSAIRLRGDPIVDHRKDLVRMLAEVDLLK